MSTQPLAQRRGLLDDAEVTAALKAVVPVEKAAAALLGISHSPDAGASGHSIAKARASLRKLFTDELQHGFEGDR